MYKRQAKPLAGKTLVLTGNFPGVGGDDDGKDGVRAMVESFGGRVTGAVSGKTDILVVGKQPGFAKVTDARHAANATLMTLHDLELGIERGDVAAAVKPVVIESFSKGFEGNGLAAKASATALAFAAGRAAPSTAAASKASAAKSCLLYTSPSPRD